MNLSPTLHMPPHRPKPPTAAPVMPGMNGMMPGMMPMGNLADMFRLGLLGTILQSDEYSWSYKVGAMALLYLYEIATNIVNLVLPIIKQRWTGYLEELFTKQVVNHVAPTDPTNEILLEKSYTAGRDNSEKVEAVLFELQKNRTVRKLIYKQDQYIVNHNDQIKVEDGIYFKLEKLFFREEGELDRISFKICSDQNILHLKQFISRCEQQYIRDKQNKLGEDMYFFDHITNASQINARSLPTDRILVTRNKFYTSRTPANVFFDNSQNLWNRINHFNQRRDWYDAKGLPYTLGFLFYGAPGCGKTSSIKAIANMCRRHIVNINFGEIKTKTQLKRLFYEEKLYTMHQQDSTYKPENIVIPVSNRLYVFEDIDCISNRDVIMSRKTKEKEKRREERRKERERKRKIKRGEPLEQEKPNVRTHDPRFAGLNTEEEDTDDIIDLQTVLNVLDGTLETPGRMVVMTSNFPEILDEALIRPGRIDMIVNFKNASHQVIRDMYQSFYDCEANSPKIEQTLNDFWTPAEVAQILFKHFDDPNKSLEVLSDPKQKEHFRPKPQAEEEEESDTESESSSDDEANANNNLDKIDQLAKMMPFTGMGYPGMPYPGMPHPGMSPGMLNFGPGMNTPYYPPPPPGIPPGMEQSVLQPISAPPISEPVSEPTFIVPPVNAATEPPISAPYNPHQPIVDSPLSDNYLGGVYKDPGCVRLVEPPGTAEQQLNVAQTLPPISHYLPTVDQWETGTSLLAETSATPAPVCTGNLTMVREDTIKEHMDRQEILQKHLDVVAKYGVTE